uniref:TFIIE beta domain-containing protein n=1 Tax=Meloidogyne enterolobii TaxID=390850 RepID=A0A6V7UAB8_MELEN|nr:unnamed protein product [Meloidogyne enterolobii]
MDPALLKARQDFMRHAISSMDTLQQIKKDGSGGANRRLQHPNKKVKEKEWLLRKIQKPLHLRLLGLIIIMLYKMQQILVDYMRKRHLNVQHWGLTLNEILDEMQVYDLNKKTILWLQEALKQNPRLDSDNENKLIYKPPHKVKNKATLFALLKKQHSDGKGGILLSELAIVWQILKL